MSGGPTDAGGLDEVDDTFWDDLLVYLEDRRVVPVIDPGVLLVGEGAARQPLEALLAWRLAERLKLPLPAAVEGGPPPALRLDDVVRLQRSASASGRRENLYLRLQQVVKELALEPPASLLELAGIEAFDLFVTVSCDDLLQRAIDRVRHAGQPFTQAVAFAPNRSADLACPRAELARPTVFHLLGRLSSSPDSVIGDDDRLEFLHALQDDARRPKLLFDALRESHLLLLGCRLPDWAARFFLRTARGERLSLAEHDTVEVLVGPEVAADRQLADFLATFRPGARLVRSSVEAFISELHRRWRAAHPAVVTPPAAAGPRREGPPDGAVFLSYSRADVAAAERMAAALRRAGVDVWFDRDELQYGDTWERLIEDGIRRSSLFVPLVSADTQRSERSDAYFWYEWNRADAAVLRRAPGERFLMPVVVDDTEPYGARVPDRFRDADFARFPGGEPDGDFVAIVQAAQAEWRRRRQGR